MARSLSKGPFVDVSLTRELKQSYEGIQIWSRRSLILPQFVGMKFLIHTGKTFLSLQVTEHMIGHKFGEFASTRKKPIHKKKGKKK